MKRLKVFQGLVNYGTQAGLFSKELKNQGVQAISVVTGDRSKRQIDVELLHGGSFVQKVFKHLWNRTRKIYWFFKYNTFHFYFGHTLWAKQRDLQFYRFFGKKVIMEYLGNDIRNYRFLVSRYNLPKDHDFYLRMEEHDEKTAKRIEYEKRFLDYTLCCLPKYMYFASTFNSTVNEILPLAIDLSNINHIPLEVVPENNPLTILHAPTKRGFKGTAYIEKAIAQLKNEGYKINFKIAEGVTHAQLFEEYQCCDIFIDQISTGWYGTAALEAMAFGKPTCAFYDELYFQYIDYADEIPVININKHNVADKLRELLDNRSQLPVIGAKSRAFVEKHHDVVKVTQKLIDIYVNKVWNGKIKTS